MRRALKHSPCTLSLFSATKQSNVEAQCHVAVPLGTSAWRCVPAPCPQRERMTSRPPHPALSMSSWHCVPRTLPSARLHDVTSPAPCPRCVRMTSRPPHPALSASVRRCAPAPCPRCVRMTSRPPHPALSASVWRCAPAPCRHWSFAAHPPRAASRLNPIALLTAPVAKYRKRRHRGRGACSRRHRAPSARRSRG